MLNYTIDIFQHPSKKALVLSVALLLPAITLAADCPTGDVTCNIQKKQMQMLNSANIQQVSTVKIPAPPPTTNLIKNQPKEQVKPRVQTAFEIPAATDTGTKSIKNTQSTATTKAILPNKSTVTTTATKVTDQEESDDTTTQEQESATTTSAPQSIYR